MSFPKDFLWGAATSAYQVEGSPLADGAGPSNWHVFAHSPGRTHEGQTGDVACDHYRRWRDDVRLMRELGLNAYRFSIAWTRVQPAGRGAANRAGLDHYERLVDALLAAGIAPCATLFHWDMPHELDERGGWLSRDIVGRFADYAQIVFRRLGDRVPLWATMNEPWVVMDAGYLHGVHPPGRANPAEVGPVSRHLLLAHAAAVRAYRAEAKREIGIVVNLEPKEPATDRPEDVAAAAREDAYMNRHFLDPLFLGAYPEELGEKFPEVGLSAEDAALVREPIDWLGINYYKRGLVRHDDAGGPLRTAAVTPSGATLTEMGWEVHPESLTRVLLWVRDRYRSIPLYITENGSAYADPDNLSPGTEVLEDPLRVQYMRRHLEAGREAIRQGVDLRGWFVWSLLDNYEWALGYSVRMGIVHVDYGSQVRTLKRSAVRYREEIAGP